MSAEAYVRERVGPARALRHPSVSHDWAEGVWDRVEVATTERYLLTVTLPNGSGEAVVKVVFSRPSHHWNRRLRRSRAAREADGYLAFCAHGIATPRLLLVLDQRRRLLFVRGAVVTERVPAPTVVEAYEPGDGGLLDAMAVRLAEIHRAGLTHGDPRTRNFLATDQGPLPFDLASWGKLSRARRRTDVLRFLGSVLLLTEDDAVVERVLARYEEAMTDLPDSPTALMHAARAWSHTKDRP